jgi:hypothetical protein
MRLTNINEFDVVIARAEPIIHTIRVQEIGATRLPAWLAVPRV